MPKSAFAFGNSTDVGRVRQENEDYFGYFSTPNGELFLVCDGMGGHQGGQRASHLAVETIRSYVSSSVELDPAVFLQAAFVEANRAIRDEAVSTPDLAGMGTTCVALLLRPGKEPRAWRAHVGDSRLYRVRQEGIEQITRDHSRVAEMLAHGLLTPAEAEKHPDKNIITRALGAHESVQPDVEPLAVCAGDRFILCSDGVSGPVPAQDIVAYTKTRTPQALAEVLVKLANERGGEDNATVQVVDVLTGPAPPKKRQTSEVIPQGKRPSAMLVALAGGSVIVLALALWAVFHFTHVKKKSLADNKGANKNTEQTGSDSVHHSKSQTPNQGPPDSKPAESPPDSGTGAKEK